MSVFVYCPRKSDSAYELVQALGATRLRRFDGRHFWSKNRRIAFTPQDAIICWGAQCPELEGVRVLNGGEPIPTKFEELQKLYGAGVPTIRVYRGKNPGFPWYGRRNNHMGGSDLLEGGASDYYVLREDVVNEYRIHSFLGKSIKAGQKVVRDGFRLVDHERNWRPNSNLAHPWVRSFDGGWRIRYDNFKSTPQMRKVAAMAVKALGLQFGAVDIGELEGGVLKVFEVNRAPGIEGGSVESYRGAIQAWLEGKIDENPRPRKRARKNQEYPNL